jgi:hypothetical protein
MRRPLRTCIAVGGLALALGGCRDESHARTKPDTAAAPAEVHVPELDELPPQAEFQEKAAQQIDAQNADETYEKLKKEIEEDD